MHIFLSKTAKNYCISFSLQNITLYEILHTCDKNFVRCDRRLTFSCNTVKCYGYTKIYEND